MPAAPAVLRTERRKFPRKDVIGAQLVSVDVEPQTSSALLLDISQNGLALQNLTAMKPGGARRVSFRQPDSGTKISVSATVVWKDGDRAGLRFVNIDEASRVALERWLHTLREVHTTSKGEATAPGLPQESPPRVEEPSPLALRDEDFYSVTARARVVTCATGAAIAWRDREGMVCRASTGLAPATGARVQLDHGLSGECVRTAAIVRCDDTENDSRVDPEVCRQLNLRSVVIVPILGEGKVAGLIEVFSNKPNAFRNEDVAGLSLLAEQCATGQVVPKPEPEAAPAPAEVPLRGFGAAPQKRKFGSFKYRAVLPWIVGGVVLLGGARLAFRHSAPAAASPPNRQSQADLAATPESTAAPPAIPRDVTEAFFSKGDAAARSVLRKERAQNAGASTGQPRQQAAEDEDEVVVRQPNGARVSPEQQNAKGADASTAPAPTSEAPPALPPGASDQRTLAALNVPSPALPSGPAPVPGTPSEITPARVVHRVSPRYPETARDNKIEGPVLLRLKVDAFGKVREVNVVSGAPELSRAAVAAVRQWRYEPFKLNGRPIDGETNVTVNFSLKGQ